MTLLTMNVFKLVQMFRLNPILLGLIKEENSIYDTIVVMTARS